MDVVRSIARQSSFRAAAPGLGMSTAAPSNSIAKLEQRLAVRLFTERRGAFR
ncbi:helix-turn-helix domain-containing protein [Paracoccus aerius]|uniref:LysR family transcriptional regulator n=1 Tax=Paracoccus aerius TaxID=1915382 RepID=A0ABS1S1Q2_9RHOB|nr:LysR family transcriptional regulator [Paracoccus aerius]